MDSEGEYHSDVSDISYHPGDVEVVADRTLKMTEEEIDEIKASRTLPSPESVGKEAKPLKRDLAEEALKKLSRLKYKDLEKLAQSGINEGAREMAMRSYIGAVIDLVEREDCLTILTEALVEITLRNE